MYDSTEQSREASGDRRSLPPRTRRTTLTRQNENKTQRSASDAWRAKRRSSSSPPLHIPGMIPGTTLFEGITRSTFGYSPQSPNVLYVSKHVLRTNRK